MSLATRAGANLHPEAVLEAASRATELTDYGDCSFVEGLTVFLQDLRNTARLHEQGAAAQFHDVVRLLSNRLRFQRDLQKYPEIVDELIIKPIVICGLPRTGSSKLQRMISADPGVQRLEVWRLLFPAPITDVTTQKPDPRIAIAEKMEAMMAEQFPQFVASHAMEAKEPDEEIFLMEMTFENASMSLRCRAPNYRTWLAERDQEKSYRYLHSLLQYLQWQDGGARDRPWILKSPVHIGELLTLLKVFPDAIIVHCHRNPCKVIPSFSSMMKLMRGMSSDKIDPLELGADFTAFWALQAERNLAARLDFEVARILDVYFEDIRDRPMTIINEIYARAGRKITSSATRAFIDYENRRPENHFGKHEYSMDHFGLTDLTINSAFSNYLNRFPNIASVC